MHVGYICLVSPLHSSPRKSRPRVPTLYPPPPPHPPVPCLLSTTITVCEGCPPVAVVPRLRLALVVGFRGARAHDRCGGPANRHRVAGARKDEDREGTNEEHPGSMGNEGTVCVCVCVCEVGVSAGFDGVLVVSRHCPTPTEIPTRDELLLHVAEVNVLGSSTVTSVCFVQRVATVDC